MYLDSFSNTKLTLQASTYFCFVRIFRIPNRYIEQFPQLAFKQQTTEIKLENPIKLFSRNLC